MSSIRVYPYPYQTSGHGHTIRDPILFDASPEGSSVTESGLSGARLRYPNVRKRVHWSSEVIDMDRNKSTRLQTRAGLSRPHTMESSSSRDSSAQLLPSKSSETIARARHGDVSLVGTSAMPSIANTSKLMAPRRGRSSDEANDARRRYSSSSTCLDEHVISVPRGDSSRSKGGRRIGVAANSSSKRDSRIIPQHPIFVVDALPAVPEPPPSRPPPAPRPARLPTPELDDTSEWAFCSYDESLCHYPTYRQYSEALSKMDYRLEAAKAYIESGRD